MKAGKEVITSKQNRTVVEIGKLTDRKARTATGLFRFDGVKLFREAMANGIVPRTVLVAESRAERILRELSPFEGTPSLAGSEVLLLADDVFAKVSEEQAPEGIVTVAPFPSHHMRGAEGLAFLADAARDPSRGILLLESVRDPGNVGTILRSAAAFGVDCVVMSTDCADVYNAKTIRGAMGALFRLRVILTDDIKDAVSLLREAGRTVYAAALDPRAIKLGEATLCRGDAVVIGNEGHGLSPETICACDKSLYVPMEPGSESLNAAVAASVILWNMYSAKH